MPIGRDFGVKHTDDGLLDLDFRDGDFQIVEGAEEVEQSIVVRLMKRLGEDPLDPDIGVPWHEIIRIGRDEYLAGMIQRALARERRIASIEEVIVETDENDPSARVVSVNATLIDGDQASPQLVFSR